MSRVLKPEDELAAYREDVRARLRAASTRTSVPALAARAGVSDASIYAFVADGSAVKPYRQTLERYERALAEPEKSGPDLAPSPAPAPAPAATNGNDATISVSRDLAFYWRGQLDIVHKLLVTLDTSVLTLRDQLAAVTEGVGGFMSSGILPDRSSAQWQPVPPVGPEAHAQAAAEEEAHRRQQEAANATPPARRRAAGGGR